MKKTFYIACILAVLLFDCAGRVNDVKPVSDEIKVIRMAIKHLQTNLDEESTKVISTSILKNSHKYKLDWKIMVSILSQESAFRKDPQKCLAINKHCADLGIAQINFRTWGRPLRLSRVKLLKDVDYNITAMSIILSQLKYKYGNESKWFTRYHSFTRSHRKIYDGFVGRNYTKINSYVRGYQDGAIHVSKR